MSSSSIKYSSELLELISSTCGFFPSKVSKQHNFLSLGMEKRKEPPEPENSSEDESSSDDVGIRFCMMTKLTKLFRTLIWSMLILNGLIRNRRMTFTA